MRDLSAHARRPRLTASSPTPRPEISETFWRVEKPGQESSRRRLLVARCAAAAGAVEEPAGAPPARPPVRGPCRRRRRRCAISTPPAGGARRRSQPRRRGLPRAPRAPPAARRRDRPRCHQVTQRPLELARDAPVEARLLALELDLDLAAERARELAGVAGERLERARAAAGAGARAPASSCSSAGAREPALSAPAFAAACRSDAAATTASTWPGCGSRTPVLGQAGELVEPGEKPARRRPPGRARARRARRTRRGQAGFDAVARRRRGRAARACRGERSTAAAGAARPLAGAGPATGSGALGDRGGEQRRQLVVRGRLGAALASSSTIAGEPVVSRGEQRHERAGRGARAPPRRRGRARRTAPSVIIRPRPSACAARARPRPPPRRRPRAAGSRLASRSEPLARLGDEHRRRARRTPRPRPLRSARRPALDVDVDRPAPPTSSPSTTIGAAGGHHPLVGQQRDEDRRDDRRAAPRPRRGTRDAR